MALNRTSDTLTRCDHHDYSALYDVRKRVDIKQDPIYATQPTHKDTIEISKDKLKEEALNRLRHTSKYVIAQNGFMRIGKYLFLAVAFPPYLMLYGLPKWILLEGLPTVASVLGWMWKKVRQKIQKPLEAGLRKSVEFNQGMRNMVQVLIQPVIRLALEFRQLIHAMREHSLQFFKQLRGKVSFILNKPRLKIIEGFRQFQKRLSNAKEGIQQRIQSVNHQLQEALQSMKTHSQIMINWGQFQYQRLEAHTKGWGIQWKNKFQNSQQLAQHATNWISNQLHQKIESFKRACQPMHKFFSQKVSPQWDKMRKICQKKWRQTKDFFHQKQQKAFTLLQKKQDKLKLLSYQSLIDCILSHVWIGKLPLRLQLWIKKCFAHPFVTLICERVVKIYSSMGQGLLQLISKGLHLLSDLVKIISKAFHFTRHYLIMSYQTVLSFIKKGYTVCRKYSLYTIYYILLTSVITAILTIWGIRYLGNFMNSLILKNSFIHKLMTLRSQQ